MRRTAAVVVLLAVVVAAVVAVSRDPEVPVELTRIEVPDPDGGVVDLDVALHLPATTPAPAVLLAHGFGSDRTALDVQARDLALHGYVVLTWSARGFGASGGTIGLNDPDREVADVSVLLDLLADRADVLRDAPGDPVAGIAGGSYGGALALLAAAQDQRLDAVAAAGSWHRLSTSLAPNAAGDDPGVWKEQWASLLFSAAAIGGAEALLGGVPSDGGEAGGAVPGPGSGSETAGMSAAAGMAGLAGLASDPQGALCGRLALDLCDAYARTAVSTTLSPADAELLDRSALDGRLGDVRAPTMLLAGQDDTLFGLEQSLQNAAQIDAPLALRWVAGGHGEGSRIDREDVRRWFDVHLRGAEHDLPAFSWVDVIADAPQPSPGLPALLGSPGNASADAEQVLHLAPGPGGSLAGAGEGGSEPREEGGEGDVVPIIRPAGGLPASVSSLPALSAFGGGGADALGGLLPSLDLPGQTAAFTTEPLDDDVTLLGGGVLSLPVQAVTGDPVVFVKVYDVSPGGQSRLLQAAANPARLDAQTSLTTPAEVQLTPLAHRIRAGNRLRVAVTTTDQAHASGTDPAVLLLGTDGARLSLPTSPGATVSALPASVRIAIPVLLVVLTALLGLALTRRHERRMTAAPAQDVDPIVIRGLVKAYADGKVAVDGLDLTVGRGQVFGLLGPNGAGKTTTMRMLLGLIHPTDGEITVLGQRLRPGHPVLERVGVLVEGPGFAPYLTGMQNLRSNWEAGGRRWAEADADRALAVADLGPAIDKPTRTYSHGMRQRLAIAQALLGDPELLVLDEPTDGLDPEQIRGMRQLLARLGAEGLTILVSSHLLAEVEQMCTHAAVVRRGQVVASGPVAELVGATRTMVVQTDEPSRAHEVLTGLVGEDAVDVEGSGLVVELGDVPPDAVVAALVGAGVAVRAATPRGRLEDAFLELTGTGS